ncbi:MAG: hypothetical protein J6U01_10190 [Clostridia bacterium]|nr:hypothetical protein [Clostridia bacterium]
MVNRTRGAMKIFGKIAGRSRCRKYVTAGDTACRKMMREVCSRKQSGPSDSAILAWANYDLAREIVTGFWEIQAA